jgi:putative ABC transport system ATP-binding protein
VKTAAAGATCAEACLKEVHKVYRMGDQEVLALSGVSLEFDPGSFWAVMGPSGSGKSTLLNILGCLDRPTSGQYLLQGDDVGTLGDDTLSELRLRRLGFVFQSFNLIPQLTVEENIQLPLYYLGWEPEKSLQRARELAAKFDLADRLEHRPTELSGGQQQRVAIARALANDPSVILADEPTGNVDSRMGEEIMQIITEMNSSGKTIIMVTHEPYIAEFARQRLYMKDGAVEHIEGGR